MSKAAEKRKPKRESPLRRASEPAKAPGGRLEGPERALRAATLFLRSARGFRLCAAIFGNPLRRDYWIERLRENLAAEKVQMTVLDLGPLERPRLLDALREHLRREPAPEGWRRAVSVVGLEPHLPDPVAPTGPARPANPFLAQANLDREIFARDCPAPVLLWLTPTGIGAFGREAPDLWHWRAHAFDFEEPALDFPEGGRLRSLAEIETSGPGTVYRNQEEMRRAAAVFREGLQASLQAHGPGHPTTCQARANLGNVLQQLGDYGQALKLFRQNLVEIEKSAHAPPDLLRNALTSLGVCLLDVGHAAEAEPMLRRALAIDEKNLGPEHPNVAAHLNNLAQLFQTNNRLREAESLMRRALAIREKGLGPGNPDVARYLNNLARLLHDTNRLAEAEPLFRRALEIDKKSLGPNHPNVASDLNNLAGLLHATNRLAEAEPLFRQALAIDEKSYGPDHPTVAIDLNNLASLLQDTNRLAEAEPLFRRALEIDKKSLGPDHPTVAIDLNNLARLLQDTNRLAEAEPLMRRALVILLKFTRATGHEHPHMRTVFGNYIGLLQEMSLSQEEIARRIESLGPEAGFGEEEWRRILQSIVEG